MSINSVLKKLADYQEKHPLLIILVMLTITLFFGYYAVDIQTDSTFDVMFSDSSNTIQLKKVMANEFGSTDTLFILVKIDNEINEESRVRDIRHPDTLKAIQTLTSSLEDETFVSGITSLATLLETNYGHLPETLEESKEMIEDLPIPVKETFLPVVLNDDYSTGSIFIGINQERKPGSLQRIEANVIEKVEQTPFPIGVTAKLTGMPVLMNRIMNYIISDNLKTILFALIGVFLILWMYFKSYKIAFFSVIPVAFTLIWLAGTMYLMDIRISVMIASVGAMIVGISVDYAIHLTHAFHHRVKKGSKHPARATVMEVGSALTASVATTIVGFMAMLLGVTPNPVTQGTVLSIGVAYAFIITMVLLPSLMILQRKYIYSHLDEIIFRIKDHSTKVKISFVDYFLSKLGEFQVTRPKTMIAIIIILTLLIIPGFGMVYMDTEDENWVPENDDVVEAMDEIAMNFGGTDNLNLLFMINGQDPDAITDLRNPEVLRDMQSLDMVLEEIKWIDVVESPTKDIASYNNNRVPQDIEQVKELIRNNPQLQDKFNEDFSIARVTIRAQEIDLDEYYEVMRELEGITFPKDIKIVPQGPAPQNIELQEMMGKDTMRTTLAGFLFVIIVASLFYMSIVAGLLAFIPIIFAIVWTIGLMGYIDLPFTVLTTGMLAILMGMGIDFSIHIIHSVEHALKELGSIEKAVPDALMSTGQAITITTITTIIGFMALSFATLVNTMRLGWTLGLGIFATFFACILIVPTVLVLKHKKKRK